MTAPDLTGWARHEGGGRPEDMGDAEIVVPLFRGTDAPHEGTPVAASTLDWHHHPTTTVTPSAMDLLTGNAPLQPSSDIIAWRLPFGVEGQGDATRYTHVRADLLPPGGDLDRMAKTIADLGQ